MAESPNVSASFQTILDSYRAARTGQGGAFGGAHPMYQAFGTLEEALRVLPAVRRRPHLRVKASPGQGNWAKVPWVALMDDRETTSTQEGVYVVFLFREDMSGVYLTLNQGVTKLKNRHGVPEARSILRNRATKLEALLPPGAQDRHGFKSGEEIDLRTNAQLGRNYEKSTATCKLYEKSNVPSDELIGADLETLLGSYEAYLESDLRRAFHEDDEGIGESTEPQAPKTRASMMELAPSSVQSDFSRARAMEALLKYIELRGFVFEPWQVAQYVTAIRTKPFVILAGITGTGKSKLPRLVEEGTGGKAELVPVRPDWTDSSEVLGYVDLEGVFRPGRVLEVAHTATAEDDIHLTLVIDEMNLARVEHYFAEVLSRIEDRHRVASGGWVSSPLVQAALKESDSEWGNVRIPPNLALVGTVNMDESAHGFSRKVLDRAFTLELSDVALGVWTPEPVQARDEDTSEQSLNGAQSSPWPVAAWWPRATRLAELKDPSEADLVLIDRVIQNLLTLNKILAPAQLQVGYRTRDEVTLFVLHSEEIRDFFRSAEGDAVDPLDLAVQMKILPRIAGGSAGVRRVLLGVMGWATTSSPYLHDEDARVTIDDWEAQGRPGRLVSARFPGVAARTCLMWDRLISEGFTSYWL